MLDARQARGADEAFSRAATWLLQAYERESPAEMEDRPMAAAADKLATMGVPGIHCGSPPGDPPENPGDEAPIDLITAIEWGPDLRLRDD